MRVVPALAAAIVVLAFASAAGAEPNTWLAFYPDPQGDSAKALDIAQLTLGSSDDGWVSFGARVRIPSTDTASIITFFVDVDGNPATGEPSAAGADYSLSALHGGRSFEVERWASGRWVVASAPSTFGSYGSPFLEIEVKRADIGNPSAIDVVAESSVRGHGDHAPDTGSVHYSLAPLALRVSRFAATSSPRGERLELVTTRSDTGGPLTGALPLCHGKVGGKVVFAALLDSAKPDEPAYCQWRFPKAMQGKPGRATITIPYAGRKVSRSVSFTVR